MRRDEIGGLRWQEIDFDKALISLPAERTKNGKPHDIPLSAAALDILKNRPRLAGREHVFGANGFAGWSNCKRELDGRIAEMLPPELDNVDCWFAQSSSAGLSDKVKLRLAFWLDRPITGAEAKTWISNYPHLDPAVYEPQQPIYIAAPQGAMPINAITAGGDQAVVLTSELGMSVAP